MHPTRFSAAMISQIPQQHFAGTTSSHTYTCTPIHLYAYTPPPPPHTPASHTALVAHHAHHPHRIGRPAHVPDGSAQRPPHIDAHHHPHQMPHPHQHIVFTAAAVGRGRGEAGAGGGARGRQACCDVLQPELRARGAQRVHCDIDGRELDNFLRIQGRESKMLER
jgi:hypothetical protein